MRKILFYILLCFASNSLHAQPYIDLINSKIISSPDAGLWRRNFTGNDYTYYNVSTNVPIIFKDSSAIVLSPFYERWDIQFDGDYSLPKFMHSLALQVNYVKPLLRQWTLTLVPVPRWNGVQGNLTKDAFQMGGAALFTYKKSNSLKYKFGLYYNDEFSGPFFVPLLGIDWQINAKDNLFGILPGSLTYEHKLNKSVYWGAVFKSITNSYRSGYINSPQGFLPKYMRVDDNQVFLYTDFYLSKNFVVNLEAGHSVFRRFRLGEFDATNPKYFFKDKINDNLLLQASLAYRMRLR